MANPLFMLARALLSSEAQSRAAPFAPQGIQQLLSNQSLAQNLAGIPSFLGYMTGLKQEPPSTNLPMDYMVSPTGVMDTAGNQMVTDQGVSGFQPKDQYGLNIGFNPNAGDLFDAFEFNDVTGGGAQGPGGGYDPFQITQIPSTEYESWWNPIDVMDLTENLPAPTQQQGEEETYGADDLMRYAAPQPMLFPRQANMER